MTNFVYELWHFKTGAGEPYCMFDPSLPHWGIGTFSSVENARAAIEQIRDKPGFRDWPGGFRIIPFPLDVEVFFDGSGIDAIQG